jgi:DNA-directed RNA polymerase specialized sigma24 family protein
MPSSPATTSKRSASVERRQSAIGEPGGVAGDDADLERIDELGSWPFERLIALLSPEQAEAVTARVIDDQSYREVAARLRCSELVARKRVSRGLTTLRAVLEEER